ncbi:MAG: hypothetical protein V4580_19055, partial [Bacteroidota bacterium]
MQLQAALFPEELLSYFELTEVSKATESQVRMQLKERNMPPEEYKGQTLHSKGLMPEIEVQVRLYTPYYCKDQLKVFKARFRLLIVIPKYAAISSFEID